MSAPTHGELDELPAYDVLCLQTDTASAAGHDHVTAVETWDPDGGRRRWTMVQVILALREGEAFHLETGSGGKTAVLEPAVCPRCPLATLVVNPPEARPPPCS